MWSTGNTVKIQIVTVLDIRNDTGDVIKNFCRTMSSENCIILTVKWLGNKETTLTLTVFSSLFSNLIILYLLIIKWPRASPSALAFYNPMIKSYYSDLMKSIFNAIFHSTVLHFTLPFCSINNMGNPFSKYVPEFQAFFHDIAHYNITLSNIYH